MNKTRIDLNKDEHLIYFQDECAESPDVWGDTGMFLVYDHRQFNVKRDGYHPRDIFEYLIDCHEQKDNNKYDNYYIFTVYAYIHSGISLSLSEGTCKWDTSSSGFILVDKNDFDFDLQRKNNDELINKTDEEIAQYYAEGLINNWNMYLSGDVYTIQHRKSVTCEHCGHIDNEIIDSISGVYAENDDEIIEEAKSHFNIKEVENEPT